MLKIGEFSKLSRVSIRMLRHYDDLGLLKPSKIDEFTGYRFYEEKQLFVMGRITALKDMGFSLADIARILEDYDDKEKMEQYFSKRQQELTEVSQQTEYKLMLLDTARKRLRKEQSMSFDVTTKVIPERYAATVHTVIPNYAAEGTAWGYMAEVKTPLVPAEPCLAVAEFLDPEYKEENVEIVVSMTVKGKYEDTEHVKFKTLPEVKVASCVFKGAYEQMGEAAATVVSWISENGYSITGPMFNIYHVSPVQTKDPNEYVTEVCFPIG